MKLSENITENYFTYASAGSASQALEAKNIIESLDILFSPASERHKRPRGLSGVVRKASKLIMGESGDRVVSLQASSPYDVCLYAGNTIMSRIYKPTLTNPQSNSPRKKVYLMGQASFESSDFTLDDIGYGAVLSDTGEHALFSVTAVDDGLTSYDVASLHPTVGQGVLEEFRKALSHARSSQDESWNSNRDISGL